MSRHKQAELSNESESAGLVRDIEDIEEGACERIEEEPSWSLSCIWAEVVWYARYAIELHQAFS